MSKEENLSFYLLKIVKDNTNIKKLQHFGLTFRQIAELIESNIKSGNLIENNDKIVLTKQGEIILQENETVLKRKDKSKWIQPDNKNKISKIERDDVYLPSRKEFSFLK